MAAAGEPTGGTQQPEQAGTDRTPEGWARVRLTAATGWRRLRDVRPLGWWARGAVFALAIGVIVLAGYLDYWQTPKQKRDGPPIELAVLLLALLALLLPEVRGALGRISSFKVGGVEVTLDTLTDAVADDVDALTRQQVADLSGLAGESEADEPWDPRVVRSLDDPPRAIKELRERLDQRLAWIWTEVPHLGDRPQDDADAVAELQTIGYLSSAHAKVLRAVVDITPKTLRSSDAAVVRRFLRQADAVVHTARLLVFDSHVRQLLRDAGYVLVDWAPQPRPQRWPDFLAHGAGKMAGDDAHGTFWISVRVATLQDSKLYCNTRRRLANPDWREEVPGGPDAIPVIVVPGGSATDLAEWRGVTGVKARDLIGRLPSLLASRPPAPSSADPESPDDEPRTHGDG